MPIQEPGFTDIAHVDSSVEVCATVSLQVGGTGEGLTTGGVAADVWSINRMNSSVLKQKKVGWEFPPTPPAFPHQGHLHGNRSHD